MILREHQVSTTCDIKVCPHTFLIKRLKSMRPTTTPWLKIEWGYPTCKDLLQIFDLTEQGLKPQPPKGFSQYSTSLCSNQSCWNRQF